MLLDAALWNIPRLRRDPTPDVTHFIDAFSRRLDPGSIPEPRQPLDLAAVGVAAEVQGDADQAHRIFADLAQLPSEAGLLGMFLTAWSSTAQDPCVLAAPLDAIESIADDPLLQARLCCKLITAAYAHQWDDALPRPVRARAGLGAKGQRDRRDAHGRVVQPARRPVAQRLGV